MKQHPRWERGSAAGGGVSGGAAVPKAVAAILDAAEWLVPQPPGRIHPRSHATPAVIGRPGALPPTRGHAVPSCRGAPSTMNACHAAVIHSRVVVPQWFFVGRDCRWSLVGSLA